MKKALRFLAVLMLLMMLFTSAFACTQAQLNKQLYAMVNRANRKVEAYVAVAQATPYDDVAWLQRKITATVNPVKVFAAAIGATVECEYESYYIDGRWVEVDPLKVINITED